MELLVYDALMDLFLKDIAEASTYEALETIADNSRNIFLADSNESAVIGDAMYKGTALDEGLLEGFNNNISEIERTLMNKDEIVRRLTNNSELIAVALQVSSKNEF